MLPKFLLLAAFCAVAANSVLGANLIGKEMCGKGQIYWCSNIMNAKRCNAVKHCIQSVWEHQILPEDNGDICNICKDMVAQARAQLESNETQEELKQVFEGSCKLIPVKIVAEECIKMVDEFIPELVETLASQMNPQMVCSVAGLCNSVRNDKLLAEYKAKLPFKDSDCDGCREVVSTMRDRFDKMNREDLMEDLLELCGRAGSLSDGCSSLVVTHLNTIYGHLTKFLRPRSVCDLAGICHAQYHRHKKPEVQIIHESSIGMLSSGDKDDIPCALCEQLVVHLRDVLVANTTEDEFKLVLRGLCMQTGSFKSECLGLVDQYFSEIYEFLTKELDPNGACEAIHICPAKNPAKRPIAPLLPAEQMIPSKAELTQLPLRTDEHMTGGWKEEGFGRKDTHLPRVHVEIDSPKVMIPAEKAQLPIERTLPQTVAAVENRQLCQMCEYFLHYLQQVLTSPATEEKLKEIVNGACEKLPKSISDSCTDFVNTYGDAIVALLAQEIDPSEVCPELGICPGKMLAVTRVEERPTCPLCLMAMTELDDMIKDNKTEDSIKRALDDLCLRMPKSISLACKDFVDGYTEELIDMLLADFTPEEVCVYLKLCLPKKNQQPTNPKADFEILSNEIPEVTHMEEVNKPILTHVPKKGNFKKIRDSSTCVICEFVMSQIDNSLKNNATDEEIKHVVHNICNYMPKTVAKECNGFVDQYADLVISFLADYMDPKDVCSALKLCSSKMYHQLKRGPAAVHLLGGKKCTWGPSYWCQSEFHANACKGQIENTLRNICYDVPMEVACNALVDAFSDVIISSLAVNRNSKEVCSVLKFFGSKDYYLAKRVSDEISEFKLMEEVMKSMVTYSPKETDLMKTNDSVMCSVCNIAVPTINLLWKKNCTFERIKSILNSACSLIPNENRIKCREFVEKYTGYVIFILKFAPDIDQKCICTVLKLCDSKNCDQEKRGTAEFHALGGKKCTWGPSYWCQSEIHANACKAIKHCQERVWNAERVPVAD